jgi:hypothetical protein
LRYDNISVKIENRRTYLRPVLHEIFNYAYQVQIRGTLDKNCNHFIVFHNNFLFGAINKKNKNAIQIALYFNVNENDPILKCESMV